MTAPEPSRKLKAMIFGSPPDGDKLARARERLMAEIEADALETAHWTGRPRFSDRVMAAMAKVPRHEFVQPENALSAYANRPQPIGYGQTISQPYIVALMTDLLDIEPTDRVLEIGTGCGYQTAVLAELADMVWSIETVEQLAELAKTWLARLGVANAEIRAGDGFAGWPEAEPFDAIMVTAAPERMPEALVAQLAKGGRMVLPIGRAHDTQTLVRVIKEDDGSVDQQAMLPVAFVPMVKRPEPRN